MSFIAAAIIAGVATIGATVYASERGKSAQEAATRAAQEQSASQMEMAREGIESAQMSPEERAYMSMLRGRAEAGLDDTGFESTTELETEKGLEALQKYYMTRGFQPSPQQTGLLIEPSQKIARDVAIQNALLRRQSQQQSWERAYKLAPMSQELIERGAGLGALPYTSAAAGVPGAAQQQLSLQQMESAGATQEAITNLAGKYIAYQNPLYQQRITGTDTGTNITPQTDYSLRTSPYAPK